ncbi:MAG: hypothetical protein ACC633_09570 [Anaerolineales bacterium]
MDLLSNLISSFDPAAPNFRPTEIYNECWLIKLILHQAAAIQDKDFQLSFLPGSTWFSEGLLPTAFKARFRGDPLSESRTNADGVIGQIKIGEKAKADLELADNASQFTVVEAKIGAQLAKGTARAPDFDQAARNVACMAEVVAQTGIKPSSLDRLDFIVLAPQSAIEKGTFSKELDPNSIQEKVKKRVDAYGGDLDDWYIDHFMPVLEKINIESLTWETSLKWIGQHKPEIMDQLADYYDLCLKYN